MKRNQYRKIRHPGRRLKRVPPPRQMFIQGYGDAQARHKFHTARRSDKFSDPKTPYEVGFNTGWDDGQAGRSQAQNRANEFERQSDKTLKRVRPKDKSHLAF
jgi:hypothetical protein